MKAISTIFLCFFFIYHVAGAQIITSDIETAPGLENPFNYSAKILDAQVDYNHNKTGDRALSEKDTLNEHYTRASSYTVYTYSQDGNTLPITGFTTFYLFIGEKFPFEGQAKILGYLIAFSQMQITTNPDSLSILLFKGDLITGQASEYIGSTPFRIDIIDTSTAGPKFTYIPFTDPQDVDGNFVAYVQTRRGGQEDDFIVIYSNMHGDGKGENRLTYMVPNQEGNLTVGDISSVFQIDGQPIDIDLMLLPVIETEGTGVLDNSIAGVSFSKLYPNPAKNNATLELVLEKPTNLEISIIGLDGRIIKTELYDYLDGNQKIELDLTGLPSGQYFYSVKTDYSKFASMFSIIK